MTQSSLGAQARAREEASTWTGGGPRELLQGGRLCQTLEQRTWKGRRKETLSTKAKQQGLNWVAEGCGIWEGTAVWLEQALGLSEGI